MMKRTKRLVSTSLPIIVNQGWNILNLNAVAPTTTDYTVYPGKFGHWGCNDGTFLIYYLHHFF
jgi:hypothetical protein